MELGPEPEDLAHDASRELLGEPVTAADARRRHYLARALRIVEMVASEPSDSGQAALLAASTSLIMAASGPQAIGQCKEEDPYADIYVVFDANGHRFECGHDPPHSSPMSTP